MNLTTAYTHKTKGTILYVVSRNDAYKTMNTIDAEGTLSSVAYITLNRWYEVSEVEAPALVNEILHPEMTNFAKEKEVVKVDSLVESLKAQGEEIIKQQEEIIEAVKIEEEVVEDYQAQIIINVLEDAKAKKVEAHMTHNRQTYTFGTVYSLEGKVVSSYYLLDGESAPLAQAQRKGVKTASAILSSLTGLAQDVITNVIKMTRA